MNDMFHLLQIYAKIITNLRRYYKSAQLLQICAQQPDTQVYTQGPSVQRFSQIEPFLKSPGCPKVSSLVLGLNLVTTPFKIEILKKGQNTPPGIYPRTKCAKFQPNRIW